jgi:hypothetical protein
MISPIFKFDSRERWYPQPVETVERLGKINGKGVDLSALPETGRIDFPDPEDMSDPDHTPGVGYHRVVYAEGLHWHQFWLWYLYNPWEIAGFGVHEGDWEFVQLATVDAEGDAPVLVTASQHRTGEKREFWRCEREGEENPRPVIYVAKGSHAHFYTAGPRGEDDANGKGDVLRDIEWRPFGKWATWPGVWGNSDGAGRSPISPGQQHERWEFPAVFHASASD